MEEKKSILFFEGISLLLYMIASLQFLQTSFFAGNVSLYIYPKSYYLTNDEGEGDWWGIFNMVVYPRGVDQNEYSSPQTKSVSFALINNLLVMFVFFVQHTVMARPAFQKLLSENVHKLLERSVHLFASFFAFHLIYYFWCPLSEIHVWDFSNSLIGSVFFSGLFMFGIIWSCASLLASVKYDLFQYYEAATSIKTAAVPDVIPFVYHYTRQPLFTGLLITYWASPDMSLGHFFFASVMTVYTFIGVCFLERDFLRQQGEKYAAYMRKVPMLIPSFSPFSKNNTHSSQSTSVGLLEKEKKHSDPTPTHTQTMPPLTDEEIHEMD